jgi:hypothetical protein
MSGKYSAEWWAQLASVTSEWVRKNRNEPPEDASECREDPPAEEAAEAA